MNTQSFLGFFLAVGALSSGVSAQTVLQTLTGSAPVERFGASVAFVGDVNNDGVSDFAVGAPWPDGQGTGYGWMMTKIGYAELRSGVNGTVLQHKDGQWTGDQFGAAIAAAGDLDGDGVPDWLAGGLDSGGYQTDLMFPQTYYQGIGEIHAYSGATGALLDQAQGGISNVGLWVSLDGLGDVNGDGRDDYIVGTNYSTFVLTFPFPIYTPVGRAEVRAGGGGGELWSRTGAAVDDDLGYSVSRAGDVNLDGLGDFLVPSPGADFVEIYGGGSFTLLRTHVSPLPNARFGSAVADVGDLDGDGVDEYAIGAPNADTWGPSQGGVFIYSGATGAPWKMLTGQVANAKVGTHVEAIGDIDLDGFVDLAVRGGLVNAQYFSVPYQTALIFSGATGETRFSLQGSQTIAGHAVSASGGADVNLDGQADLLLGSYDNSFYAGMVEIFSTAPIGLTSFGAGTAGCAGPQRLTGDSVPAVGNAGFEFRGDHASPSLTTLVLVSDAADAGSDALGLGVIFHVNLFQATELLAIDGQSSAVGLTSAPAPIPSNPALVGKIYYAQEFTVWPSGPCVPSPFNVSSTSGLTITIQP